jgi:hypothetical protein
MKQNFSITVSYFLYFGIAVFLHPAKNLSNSSMNSNDIQQSKKMEKLVVMQSSEILRGELLFKY